MGTSSAAPDGTAWTFDTFVVSESSRAAFEMAVAVAEDPTRPYNPLLLHGPVGSGKSHLLHAIAHGIRSSRPDATVVYLPTETVVAQLTDAIRRNELREFRRVLSAIDALLLDDFQVGPDRKHTREEIFRTLEELLTYGVQVVVASAVPLTGIRPAARPLFEQAVVVEVGYPERGARAEIIRGTAAMRDLILPDGAIDDLVEQLNGSPREIQSAIARIAAETAISPEPLDRSRVARIVSRVQLLR